LIVKYDGNGSRISDVIRDEDEKGIPYTQMYEITLDDGVSRYEYLLIEAMAHEMMHFFNESSRHPEDAHYLAHPSFYRRVFAMPTDIILPIEKEVINDLHTIERGTYFKFYKNIRYE